MVTFEYDVIMHRSARDDAICIRAHDERLPEHAGLMGEFGFAWDRDQNALVLPRDMPPEEALGRAGHVVGALTDAGVEILIDVDLHDLPTPTHLADARGAGQILHASAAQVPIRPHPHDQARIIDGLSQEGGVFDGLSHLMGRLLERAEDHSGTEGTALAAALRAADVHLASAATELDRASTLLAAWTPGEAPDLAATTDLARTAAARATSKAPATAAPVAAHTPTGDRVVATATRSLVRQR